MPRAVDRSVLGDRLHRVQKWHKFRTSDDTRAEFGGVLLAQIDGVRQGVLNSAPRVGVDRTKSADAKGEIGTAACRLEVREEIDDNGVVALEGHLTAFDSLLEARTTACPCTQKFPRE